MKHKLYSLIGLVFVIIIVACNDEEPELVPFVFEVKVNSESWVIDYASAITRNDHNDSIGIYAVLNEADLVPGEKLIIHPVPFELGKFSLSQKNHPTASFYTLIHDNEIVHENFDLDDGAENYVDIVKIDTIGMQLEGRFQLTMIKNPTVSNSYSGYGDTLYFTEGYFELPLYKHN